MKLAEGEGIEPSRPVKAGYGLANRPIAALATFHWRAVKESNHHPSECHGFQDRFEPCSALPVSLRFGAPSRNRTQIRRLEDGCAIHCTKGAVVQRLDLLRDWECEKFMMRRVYANH